MAGWLVAGSVAALAAARLARLDESSDLLLLAGGLTPFLWLPALAALGVGLLLRRRALAALAGAVAVVYLAWALPGLGFPEAVPAGQGVELRLFSANLHYQNADAGPIAAEIGAADPDVVALQELSPQSGAGLRRAGVLDAYPYSVVAPRQGAFGMGLWSRLPLSDARPVEVEGAVMIRAEVALASGPVTLWSVHTVAPIGPARDRWRRQLRWLGQAAGQDRPLIMAGDFNATRWHRGLGRLLADGLTDAHERRGRGWVPTWPAGRRLLPPLLRLDHVLVSPEIAVRAVREGTGSGSDHRPLVADLVLG